MPRHRPGLGQGLQALVTPVRAEEEPAPALLPTPAPAPAPLAQRPAWEYAVLRPRRKKKKNASAVTILTGDLLQRRSRKKLTRIPQLAALGVLGASGWELVSVQGETYFLKRPAGGR